MGRTEDPDILFLSETKLTEKELEKFKWRLGPGNMVAWSAVGSSRWVALLWKKEVKVTLRSYGRRHIDVDVMEDSGSLWRLTGIYGESEAERKTETRRTLRLLGQQHRHGRPWMCFWDFNEILMDGEKVGGSRRPQACMDRFRETLENARLCDIGYTGDKFTWRNHSKELQSYICERLDRITANTEWCEVFPGFAVVNERPRHSDHRPLVVNTEGDVGRQFKGGDRGFRFEAWWLQEEGCAEVIREAWDEGRAEGELPESAEAVARRTRANVLQYEQIYSLPKAGQTPQRWRPPPDDMIKINTDGSFVPGQEGSGWGVIARDAAGEVVAARPGRQDHVHDAFASEVYALAHAISFAAELGLVRVIFETDSSLLLEAMDFARVDASAYAAVIEDLKFQLKMWFSKHKITVCHREANSVAYQLASIGRMYAPNHFEEWENLVPAPVAVCVVGNLPSHHLS
ncbi:Elongation factor 1-alpha [Hordeum vulgare]|nr:Elongation factor 1-alpha [Hordeum vulgare]